MCTSALSLINAVFLPFRFLARLGFGVAPRRRKGNDGELKPFPRRRCIPSSLHRAFPSFACRTESGPAVRASERARRSSRFRLCAVQIYSSRDFYLIPISRVRTGRLSGFAAANCSFFFHKEFPYPSLSTVSLACTYVNMRAIESQMLCMRIKYYYPQN